jgi:hypothetical protein
MSLSTITTQIALVIFSQFLSTTISATESAIDKQDVRPGDSIP